MLAVLSCFQTVPIANLNFLWFAEIKITYTGVSKFFITGGTP
jgi:hypothetical protein